MRTTLNIDDDVLEEVKELAKQEGCTIGKALSDLARQGFFAEYDEAIISLHNRGREPMITSRMETITLEHVQTIMEAKESQNS